MHRIQTEFHPMLGSFPSGVEERLDEPFGLFLQDTALPPLLPVSGLDVKRDFLRDAVRDAVREAASIVSTSDSEESQSYGESQSESRKRARETRRTNASKGLISSASVANSSDTDPPSRRASAATDIDPTEAIEEQGLKRKRLARKAELARDSRRKKKMRLEELEAKVADLQAQLASARAEQRSAPTAVADSSQANPLLASMRRCAVVRPAELVHVCAQKAIKAGAEHQVAELSRQQQLSLLEQLGQPISDAPEDQTVLTSKQLGEAIKAFQAAAASSVEAPLLELEALAQSLEPHLALRFLQWLVSQNDDFYRNDPKALWVNLLRTKLGVPEATSSAMLAAVRADAVALRGVHSEITATFARLNSLVRARAALQRHTLDQVRSSLSPLQQANLLQWVDQFGEVCVNIKVDSK